MKKRLLLFMMMLSCVLTFPVSEAGGKNNKKQKVNYYKLMLKDKFTPVSKEELALTEVPFAPGAPAVVLLEGQQQTYKHVVTEEIRTFITECRRIKILKESGVEDYSDYHSRFSPGTMVQKVLARTILPDGTEVDASDNINQDETETGGVLVSVAFPQVEKGAILDLVMVYNVKGVTTSEWQPSKRIPVLDSRLIISPPAALQIRTSYMNISPEEAAPKTLTSAGSQRNSFGESTGRTAIWHFTDVPPIPDEPNQPPFMLMAKTLWIIPIAWHTNSVHIDFASDWERWSKEDDEGWDYWIKSRRSKAKELAAEVTAGMESTKEKIEAVREVLKDRVRVLRHSDGNMNNSADETLIAGSGTSADVAGTMVAMLRSLDMDADVASIRRRQSGPIPADFPMPILFNDAMVRVRTELGDIWVSPVSEIPVGTLPGYCRGVMAAVADKDADGPITLPDYKASENKTIRTIKLELDVQGNVTGESTHRHLGVQAEHWRALLRYEEEDKRKLLVQDALRRWMPGAVLQSLESEDLEENSNNLTLKCRFNVPGYATSAGSRLIMNPNVMERIDIEDWAAASRETDIDLGMAYETKDTITVKLPEQTVDVRLPGGADYKLAGRDFYKSSFTRRGNTVIARRHISIDTYRYVAAAWITLKQAFTDIAAQDDQAMVVTVQ